MRALSNPFRIIVFTACATWLMMRTPVVYAQLQNCSKFNTEDDVQVCNNCCGSSPYANGWTDGTTSGAGTQQLSTQYASCGSPTTRCPGGTDFTGCGQQPWLQAVDSGDCCLPSGTPCNQGTCCNGLICLSSNSCGTCISQGGWCGSASDCCSGLSDPQYLYCY
jgi:hypothetical protein